MLFNKKKNEEIATLTRLLLSGEGDMLYNALILLAGDKGRLSVIDSLSKKIVVTSADIEDSEEVRQMTRALIIQDAFKDCELPCGQIYKNRKLERLRYGKSSFLYILTEYKNGKELTDEEKEYIAAISYTTFFQRYKTNDLQRDRAMLRKEMFNVEATDEKYLVYLRIANIEQLYQEIGESEKNLIVDDIYEDIRKIWASAAKINFQDIGFISTGPYADLRNKITQLLDHLNDKAKFRVCFTPIDNKQPENSMYRLEIQIEKELDWPITYIDKTHSVVSSQKYVAEPEEETEGIVNTDKEEFINAQSIDEDKEDIKGDITEEGDGFFNDDDFFEG